MSLSRVYKPILIVGLVTAMTSSLLTECTKNSKTNQPVYSNTTPIVEATNTPYLPDYEPTSTNLTATPLPSITPQPSPTSNIDAFVDFYLSTEGDVRTVNIGSSIYLVPEEGDTPASDLLKYARTVTKSGEGAFPQSGTPEEIYSQSAVLDSLVKQFLEENKIPDETQMIAGNFYRIPFIVEEGKIVSAPVEDGLSVLVYDMDLPSYRGFTDISFNAVSLGGAYDLQLYLERNGSYFPAKDINGNTLDMIATLFPLENIAQLGLPSDAASGEIADALNMVNNYSFKNVLLYAGQNNFELRASDASGNLGSYRFKVYVPNFVPTAAPTPVPGNSGGGNNGSGEVTPTSQYPCEPWPSCALPTSDPD